MIDISAMRERAEAAKERAEKASDEYGSSAYAFFGDDENYHVTIGGKPTEIFSKADARFIEHARADVPQLAQDLLEALEEIERLKMGDGPWFCFGGAHRATKEQLSAFTHVERMQILAYFKDHVSPINWVLEKEMWKSESSND